MAGAQALDHLGQEADGGQGPGQEADKFDGDQVFVHVVGEVKVRGGGFRGGASDINYHIWKPQVNTNRSFRGRLTRGGEMDYN